MRNGACEEKRGHITHLDVHVPENDVKRVIEAAFAHRRKTLPNSLELAGVASGREAAGALAALGRDPETRAEALAPPSSSPSPRAS